MATIGIDLGTTNSVIAVFDGRTPRILTNAEGQRLTPSVVGFGEDDLVRCGSVARRQQAMNPERTIRAAKRVIGREFASLGPETRTLGPLVQGAHGLAAFEIGERQISPVEVAAHLLSKLKADAEESLGEVVESAVITIPASFDDLQRRATTQAAEIAGFSVQRLVNEPTAAALAFRNDDGAQLQGRVIVFDLGGGTFDVSLLELSTGVVEVIASAGDQALGGDDMDRSIADWLRKRVGSKTGQDLEQDPRAWWRVLDAAERAKWDLSLSPSAKIQLPFLLQGESGAIHVDETLERSHFEQLIAGLVSRTISLCERVLEDAGIRPGEVEHVLLVGGATRVPLVRERVAAFFGKDPLHSLHPDEAVALGAAVHAAILGGDYQEVMLLDVTPLTLGIETRGGVMTPLVERNTTIPTRVSRVFSTAVDNQGSIEVHVLQGERPLAHDNRSLGRFELGDLPRKPRGGVRIQVTFDIDASGNVRVSAHEEQSGRSAQVRIRGSGSLPADEVEAILEQAQRARKADRERQELVGRRNALESTLLNFEARVGTATGLSGETRDRAVVVAETLRKALGAEILDEARYMELNSRLLAVATQVEDELLAAASRTVVEEA